MVTRATLICTYTSDLGSRDPVLPWIPHKGRRRPNRPPTFPDNQEERRGVTIGQPGDVGPEDLSSRVGSEEKTRATGGYSSRTCSKQRGYKEEGRYGGWASGRGRSTKGRNETGGPLETSSVLRSEDLTKRVSGGEGRN